MDEIYNDIQEAIDYAFLQQKYLMNSYSYLKIKNIKRTDAQIILRSSLIKELHSYVKELNLYLQGGQEPDVIYAREAYGYLSKPDARKISNYLDNIIEGIKKYISERKGGNRKKRTPAK
jgi:hypothetical protein